MNARALIEEILAIERAYPEFGLEKVDSLYSVLSRIGVKFGKFSGFSVIQPEYRTALRIIIE